MRFVTPVRTLITLCLAMTFTHLAAAEEKKEVPATLNFSVKDIAGQDVALSKYQGKVVLVVNVASKCGYTKQYKGLQELHDKFAEKGLAVLGFPCNQFGGQEPGSEADVKEFCESKFGVKFDLFSKIDVNGNDAAPFYKALKSTSDDKGEAGDVKWNFEKFLIGRDGKIIGRYRSATTPEQLAAAITEALAAE